MLLSSTPPRTADCVTVEGKFHHTQDGQTGRIGPIRGLIGCGHNHDQRPRSDEPGTAEDLARLAISLHDEPGVIETVDKVLEYAVQSLDCDYAGVIFVHARSRMRPWPQRIR